MSRRTLRKLHNIFGLVVGIQVAFWVVSGLFFTLFPIEKIHGTTLRAPVEQEILVFDQVQLDAAQAATALGNGTTVKSAMLDRFLGEPVWKFETADGVQMVSATGGELLSPISPDTARKIALEGMLPEAGTPSDVWLMMANPPREYTGPLPAYVIEYDPSALRVYIDANTGRLVTVRTNLWRTFDVLWRFHIMDITNENEFDTWWMKLIAFLSLAMVLTGIVLLIQGLRRGTLFR